MLNPVIIELLQKVQFYYPIGLPQIYTAHPGFVKLKEILQTKIVEIENDSDTPWTFFMREISEKNNSKTILDQSYLQFPSYKFEIQFESSHCEGIKLERSLSVAISLLTNHYTFFIQDHYSLKHEWINDLNKILPEYKLIYLKEFWKEDFEIIIRDTKGSIKKYFPDHQFVDHKLLFDFEIEGGSVYNRIDQHLSGSKDPLYTYLFSNDLISGNFAVFD